MPNSETKIYWYYKEDTKQLNNEQSKEIKSDWESKEKELFFELDKKMDILIDFKKIIDGTKLKESHEEVKEKLEGFFLKIKFNSSQETKDLFKEFKKIEKKEELEFFFESPKRKDEILSNNDAKFLINLKNLTKELINKNKFIKHFENNEEELKGIGTEKGLIKMLTIKFLIKNIFKNKEGIKKDKKRKYKIL